MSKKIAVFGKFEVRIPVRQRYWKWIYHRSGPDTGQRWYKKRVWKNTTRTKKAEQTGRYEFRGTGRDLQQAVLLATQIVPKGYIDVQAEQFLEHPERYGTKGVWIEFNVES